MKNLLVIEFFLKLRSYFGRALEEWPCRWTHDPDLKMFLLKIHRQNRRAYPSQNFRRSIEKFSSTLRIETRNTGISQSLFKPLKSQKSTHFHLLRPDANSFLVLGRFSEKFSKTSKLSLSAFLIVIGQRFNFGLSNFKHFHFLFLKTRSFRRLI